MSACAVNGSRPTTGHGGSPCGLGFTSREEETIPWTLHPLGRPPQVNRVGASGLCRSRFERLLALVFEGLLAEVSCKSSVRMGIRLL